MNEDEHRREMFRQTNQAAVDFSLKSLQGLFLLNGAAATALLANGKSALVSSALWFAVGAALAVAALGLSYLYTLLLAESWRTPLPSSSDEEYLPVEWPHKVQYISLRQLGRWRCCPIGVFILSLIFFCIGVYSAASVSV